MTEKNQKPLVGPNLAYRYYRSAKGKEKESAAPYAIDRNPARPSDLLREGIKVPRRDFLKFSGFALAGGLLSGCLPKAKKVVPYLVKPEEVEPGLSRYYATVCQGCSAGCGVLAEVRDGRPIKLEGNPDHPLSKGGLCAVGQAHLLELYDSKIFNGPLWEKKQVSFEEASKKLVEVLEPYRKKGSVRLLWGTTTSLSEKEIVARFLSSFADGKAVTYDALSYSAILDAHEKTHGVRRLPHYRLEDARLIVSFDADFLGAWLSPVEFTKAFSAGRNPENAKGYKRLIVVESRLSPTGANADDRVVLSPSQLPAAVAFVTARVAKATGREVSFQVPKLPEKLNEKLEAVSRELLENRGNALVLCGANDLSTQKSVNLLNEALGAYPRLADLRAPSYQAQGSDAALENLIQEMEKGRVAVLFVRGCNPAYDTPDPSRFEEALKKVQWVVTFSVREDETSRHAHVNLPEPHPLACWRDLSPVEGIFSVAQPAIQRLRDVHTLAETLSALQGKPKEDRELVRDFARREIFPRTGEASFQSFWTKLLAKGWAKVPVRKASSPSYHGLGKVTVEKPLEEGLEFSVYPTVAMRDGRHAHNAWLQELPDPVTKVTWDNYVSLSPNLAQRLKVEEGDQVQLKTVTGKELVLPVYVLPGHDDRTVSIALGYGRMGTDRFETAGPKWILKRRGLLQDGKVGKNAAVLLSWKDGFQRYHGALSSLEATGEKWLLATTQRHHSLSVPQHLAPGKEARRPLVQETTLEEYRQNPKAGSHPKHALVRLWAEDHKYEGHRWAMAVDLSKCTGCSACVLACQIENNVPVVGKDEVARSREMHWLRIDRYFADRGEGVSVVHEPMLCQHCGNAPCETVCPVLATSHSEEGLNMQVYNRCIGTRYCANNCPYKVRRFNWFNYPHEDALQNLGLNPDVTVRTRGVMEKCTFCVQRIQEAKAEAKKEGAQKVFVQTACQQSCPADAIVFGDRNDPKDEVAQVFENPRAFHVLEEIGTEPMVAYLTRVWHRSEKGGEGHA